MLDVYYEELSQDHIQQQPAFNYLSLLGECKPLTLEKQLRYNVRSHWLESYVK